MLNYDYNKKVTGSELYNDSNDLSVSSRPNTFQKKFRKDAKDNLILKKNMKSKKSKHHIYFIDKIDSTKELATIINIESYKKYNLDNVSLDFDENEENNNNDNNKDKKEDKKQLIEETNIVTTNGCCIII